MKVLKLMSVAIFMPEFSIRYFCLTLYVTHYFETKVVEEGQVEMRPRCNTNK